VLQAVISLVVHAFSPLVFVGPAILLWRRNASVMVAGVCATTLAYVGLGFPLGPVVPSTLAAVIWAVTHNARVAAWLSLGGLWLGWLGLGWLHVREFGSLWGEARWAGYALLAALFAEVVDNRRQRVAAYRRLYAEEQRRRAEQEQRRVSEERLSIARELHDVWHTACRSSPCAPRWRWSCSSPIPTRCARHCSRSNRRARAGWTRCEPSSPSCAIRPHAARHQTLTGLTTLSPSTLD
jgi:hypothetical protein